MYRWLFILGLLCTTYVNAETTVLAISGSTRQDSANKKLVTEAANLARNLGATVTMIDLKAFPMPLYDADLEAETKMPETAKKLRNLMIQNQVIMISSPEYNGSISAVLKNAIDWSSRNETGGPSRDAFKGKKFVIMSASPSPSGGINGLNHLKAIIENIGGTVVSQQFALSDAYNAFNAQGELKDQNRRTELQNIVKSAVK